MACPEFQDRILEALDAGTNPVSPAERAALDAHLAACAACRDFAETQRQLDARLCATFAAPRLSPNFARRVLSAVDAQPASISPEWRAERRLALEAEYRARLRSRRGWALGVDAAGWMELLGWGVGAGCAAVGFVKCQVLLPALVTRLGGGSHDGVRVGLVWGLTAVAIGLAWAWRARWIRMRF